MSESRRIRRYLLHRARHGHLKKGECERSYADNRGIEYQYAWEAKLSSFVNFVASCFKNGFPIVVSRLWYPAWAYYPFFFLRKDLKAESAVLVLNHERIHIRQQRDIHLTVSLPLVALCLLSEVFGWFNPICLLCIVPFIPTVVYGIEMLRVWAVLLLLKKKCPELNLKVGFALVRFSTCFEREATVCSTDSDYLLHRKMWSVFKFCRKI